MRQLQTQEVKAVSGAGLIVGTITTGAQAANALGKGLISAGTIVGKPVVNTLFNVIKVIV